MRGRGEKFFGSEDVLSKMLTTALKAAVVAGASIVGAHGVEAQTKAKNPQWYIERAIKDSRSQADRFPLETAKVFLFGKDRAGNIMDSTARVVSARGTSMGVDYIFDDPFQRGGALLKRFFFDCEKAACAEVLYRDRHTHPRIAIINGIPKLFSSRDPTFRMIFDVIGFSLKDIDAKGLVSMPPSHLDLESALSKIKQVRQMTAEWEVRMPVEFEFSVDDQLGLWEYGLYPLGGTKKLQDAATDITHAQFEWFAFVNRWKGYPAQLIKTDEFAERLVQLRRTYASVGFTLKFTPRDGTERDAHPEKDTKAGGGN